VLNNKGMIMMNDGGKEKAVKSYTAQKWYDFHITVKATLNGGSYDAWVNGEHVITKAPLAEAVRSVERISFRTGSYRDLPSRTTPNETPAPPLPGADERVEKAVFYIDDVQLK